MTLKEKWNKVFYQYNWIELLSFLIVFFVFMGSNFLKFTIDGIRLNVARILMIIPVFILLVDFFKNKKEKWKFCNKSLEYCIVFFIAWSIYSILSIYLVKDMMHYFTVNYYICIGTINILFFTKMISVSKHEKILLNIINIAVFINCLYYLWLYFIQKQNIGGFYHNSNDLATVLILAMVSAIYLIMKYKDKRNRITQIFFLVIDIICFINIQSRACLLGVIFALIIMAIWLAIKHKETIFKKKFAIPVIVIIFLLATFLGILFYIKLIGNISLKPVENAQKSNDIRTNLIFNGFYFLSQGAHLLTGIGAGNTMYYLQHYSIYPTKEIYNFHNFWLDILVEYGILIFVGFMITYIIMIKNLCQKGNKKMIHLSRTFIFFWIAFILASISSSTIFTREWLWIIFALTIAYCNKGKKEVE